MLIVAGALVLAAILILWFGKPLIIAYIAPSNLRANLTSEQISAAAGRLALAIGVGLIVIALIVVAIAETGRLYPG